MFELHILLVNDDGIHSEALALLCRSAAARGHRVTVSAPSTQQSGKSHCFTLFQPVQVHPAEMEGAEEAWAVDGTPVDSCRLGLMALTTDVDCVISGVNDGINAGLATYVSGTVGAAREAAFQLKPSMAVSMAVGTPQGTLALFADWAIMVAEHLVEWPERPALSVCNLNVPAVEVHELKKPVMCPIGTNIYQDSYHKADDPRGQLWFFLGPEKPDDSPVPGSDIDLLKKGHITCTFLTPEVTEQSQYQSFLDSL